MIAFAFTLEYPSADLTVESHDPGYMLAAHQKSRTFDVSNHTPDDNENDRWSAAVADTGDKVGESGSGVLSRLSLSSEPGALPGLRTISLVSAAHIDPQNQSHVPDTIYNAVISIDEPCAAPVP
jgi:hypothetical protein